MRTILPIHAVLGLALVFLPACGSAPPESPQSPEVPEAKGPETRGPDAEAPEAKETAEAPKEIRIIIRIEGDRVSVSVGKKHIACFPYATDPKKLEGISAKWEELGREVERLYKRGSADRPIPVKIHAEGKVPFQYVVCSLDTCLRYGVKDIEFVGSSKVHEPAGAGSTSRE
jgi:hypothetical protein